MAGFNIEIDQDRPNFIEAVKAEVYYIAHTPYLNYIGKYIDHNNQVIYIHIPRLSLDFLQVVSDITREQIFNREKTKTGIIWHKNEIEKVEVLYAENRQEIFFYLAYSLEDLENTDKEEEG